MDNNSCNPKSNRNTIDQTFVRHGNFSCNPEEEKNEEKKSRDNSDMYDVIHTRLIIALFELELDMLSFFCITLALVPPCLG